MFFLLQDATVNLKSEKMSFTKLSTNIPQPKFTGNASNERQENCRLPRGTEKYRKMTVTSCFTDVRSSGRQANWGTNIWETDFDQLGESRDVRILLYGQVIIILFLLYHVAAMTLANVGWHSF